MYHLTVSEAQMPALGQALARALEASEGGLLYLDGTLGMGKTTLSQAVIAACGWPGRVTSPTYTLVEPYEGERLTLVHVDLYRLADPEELEFLGLRDYLGPATAWLVEWPERGAGVLPEADVVVHFTEAGTGRALAFDARGERGQVLVRVLRQEWERP